MKQSCRAANFCASLEDKHIRSQVEELVEAFEETVAEDRRGTRLRESTLLHTQPSHNFRGKPLKSFTLPNDCFSALIDYLNHKAGQELFADVRRMCRVPGIQQLSNKALKCPRIFHGGVSFLSSSDSPRDSNLMFRSPTMSFPRPGRVLQIFTYSIWNAVGALTEATYLYVAPLEPLSPQDATQDPYRSYKHGGGELYYDRYLAGIIITPEDIVSHYARTPLVMPSIPLPCVHTLSLDKVCRVVNALYFSPLTCSMRRACASFLIAPVLMGKDPRAVCRWTKRMTKRYNCGSSELHACGGGQAHDHDGSRCCSVLVTGRYPRVVRCNANPCAIYTSRQRRIEYSPQKPRLIKFSVRCL